MTVLKNAARYLLAALLIMGALLLSACAAPAEQGQVVERFNSVHRPFDLSDAVEEQTAQEPIELNIVSIGDILLHYPWQPEFAPDGSSVFPEYFEHINDLSLGADLALCNVEAPFAGGEPSGYPLFNMGDTMAPAVSGAGFDVVYTSHNHMLDYHDEAVFRTLQVLREANLLTAGSRQSVDEPNYALLDLKGVKTAVIAYTYESSPDFINGIPISEAIDPHINSFTASSDEDLAEMKSAIDASRAAGADLVIFYLHAGDEYSHEPNADQRNVAQFLIDNGVDIIFGSHVHVVQPMEMLQPSDGSAPVPVFWGMGNYISGQVVEGGMETANEVGILATVNLTWNPETKEIDAFTMEYLALCNTFYYADGRIHNTVIPERGDIAENPAVLASGKLDRVLNAFNEVHKVMGEQSLNWKRT